MSPLVVVSEHALLGLESFEIERLGLGVAALVPVHVGQVVHGEERARVVVSEQEALFR